MQYVKSYIAMKLEPKCVKFTYKLIRTFFKPLSGSVALI